MEFYQPPKLLKLMPQLPRQEPIVGDSTSRLKAKTCKRLYFYEMVLGYRPKGDPVYFAFGGAYHKFREVLENTQDVKLAITAAIAYWQKKGSNPPVGAKFDFLTLDRLMASCKEAFQWWKREKEQGKIEVIKGLVEGPVVVTLKDGKTKIGARFDQLVRWSGKLWSRDFKTSSRMGKYYERTLEPNDQFMRQTLTASKISGERVDGVLVEVMYNTKKEGPKVVPFVTTRSQDQLNRWEDEQIYLEAELARNREDDCWPMEEKHCPYCPFRLVCKAASDQGAIAQLKNSFEHRPWDFTATSLDGDEDEAVETVGASS